MSQVFDPDGLARALVDARQNDLVLAVYPGARPGSLAEAYRVQDSAISLWPDRVAGWKVGRVAAEQVQHFNADRLAGPIFASSIVEACDGSVPEVPVLRGFAAVEAEIILRVASRIEAPLSNEQALLAVDQIRLGIEVASSPLAGINDDGPAVTASDFGNNHGLVLGPQLSGISPAALHATKVELSVDGVSIGEGRAADLLDGPFGSLAYLSRVLHARGIAIEAGEWISTGALTGVHRVGANCIATARFGDVASVSCRTIRKLFADA